MIHWLKRPSVVLAALLIVSVAAKAQPIGFFW